MSKPQYQKVTRMRSTLHETLSSRVRFAEVSTRLPAGIKRLQSAESPTRIEGFRLVSPVSPDYRQGRAALHRRISPQTNRAGGRGRPRSR